MRRLRAFTIVELLVVIGIITVLIAILLPALKNAREQARVVVCASNERQIYQFMCLYAADNRGVLPIPSFPEPTWPRYPNVAFRMDGYGLYNYAEGTLWPYIRGGPDVRQRLFLCPSDGPDRGVHLGTTTVGAPGLTRNYSYNFNEHLTGTPTGAPVMTDHGMIPSWTGIKLPQIKGADHKLLVLEADDPEGGFTPISTVNVGSDGQIQFVSLLSHRHFGHANQCFADGHVELFDDSALAPVAQAKHFCVLLPTQGGYLP